MGAATGRIISADDHMDMHTLPPRLFEERLPAPWRDRAPRVTPGERGPQWVAEGKSLGTSGRQHGAGIVWAFEKAGLADDGYRPSNPELRLQDMEMDGVHAQVIYGPVRGLQIADPALGEACLRVYNDWALEFNAADPSRLCLLAQLPSYTPQAAADEAQRVAKAGHRGAIVGVFEGIGAPIYDRAWEPLWATAHDAGMPLSFHFGGGTTLVRSAATTWMMPAYVSCLPLQLDERLAAMIFCGALERHPAMRLVIAESGLGWLPYFIERMDLMYDTYNHLTKDYPLTMRPREIFRRQVFVTFQEDPIGVPLIPHIGEGNVMWASDYPHPNSTFPHSRRAIDELFAAMPAQTRRKVTCDNAAALYRLAGAPA